MYKAWFSEKYQFSSLFTKNVHVIVTQLFVTDNTAYSNTIRVHVLLVYGFDQSCQQTLSKDCAKV